MKSVNPKSVTASILDRLIDLDPANIREVAKSGYQQLEELRAHMRRDLENLLNSRRPEITWPIAWRQLSQSLMAYGMPDISSEMLDSLEMQERWRLELVMVIRFFETRLKNVQVTLIQTDSVYDRGLRLRIKALLMIEPAPEPIVFDSVLHQDNYFQIIDNLGDA